MTDSVNGVKFNVHKISSGETLYKIAQDNNISISELLAHNPDIKDPDHLSIGQNLNIPSSASKQTYSVAAGDNLEKIAKKYNTTVDQILKANPNIKDKNKISAGMALTIPPPSTKDSNPTKTTAEFYEALGMKESRGNYKAENRFGYIGKYQMGEQALVEAGYYKKSVKSPKDYNNDWSGTFTGKDGVLSKADFLNNTTAQENAQTAYQKAQWKQLQANGSTKFIGQTINGIKITPSALLGGAHLVGSAKVHRFLESNGKTDTTDRNGVSVSQYMKKFQDYDVSSITQQASGLSYSG